MAVTILHDRANPEPISREMRLLLGERDALQESLRKFHVDSPRRVDFKLDSKWVDDMDDDDSSDFFGQLEISIRKWAVKEAKTLSQLDDLQGRDREFFFKEVAKIVLLEGPNKQELPKRLESPRVLAFILGALLHHHIFKTVYVDPFFFLGEETSQILNDIMLLGNIWNLGASQHWRGDTLKILRPLGKTPDARIIESVTKKLLRNAAVSKAAEFMRTPAKYIVNDHPGTLQRLADIYMEAAEHSFKIWVQPPKIKLLDDPPSFLGQAFDSRNKFMKAHDRVNHITNINPNGQKITMVVSPAIVRCGVRLADMNYYETRWWHETYMYRPAKVWFYVPRPGSPVINEQEFEPMPIPPPPVNEWVTITPPRSDLSPETLTERFIERFDRVTSLELVKPYLDDFAEQLRPVIEGLRGEVAQRIEECNEMEKERDEFRRKYLEALGS
ncbi:hypothetical protein ACHAO1_004350 [Botrytis cinerea]